MWFSSLLQNPKRSGLSKGRRVPSASRRRSTFRPQLEALEDRWMPSILTVTNNFDSGRGSLRYEIAHANSKDTIVFDPSLDRQTITLIGGELVVNKNLTIKGPGAGLLTVSSSYTPNEGGFPSFGSRLFEVDGANTTVSLSGLTLSNYIGTADLGFFSQAYDGLGGAILNFGRLTVSGCSFSSSGVGVLLSKGGAIYNAGTMTVSGCTISGNSAVYGGGIYNAGAMTVIGCTLSNNTVFLQGGLGGGIYNAGTVTVTGCTLSGNFAAEGGGIYNAGKLTVSNSVFSGNYPDNIFGSFTDGGGNIFK
jgi:hypothetical protein